MSLTFKQFFTCLYDIKILDKVNDLCTNPKEKETTIIIIIIPIGEQCIGTTSFNYIWKIEFLGHFIH